MFHLTRSQNGKLTVVAIGPLHDTYSFYLVRGKGFHRPLFVADQAQPSNATAIGEGDVLAIGFDAPSGLFVLHRAVIVLKLRIALLARLLGAAILIEAG